MKLMLEMRIVRYYYTSSVVIKDASRVDGLVDHRRCVESRHWELSNKLLNIFLQSLDDRTADYSGLELFQSFRFLLNGDCNLKSAMKEISDNAEVIFLQSSCR